MTSTDISDVSSVLFFFWLSVSGARVMASVDQVNSVFDCLEFQVISRCNLLESNVSPLRVCFANFQTPLIAHRRAVVRILHQQGC
jgi:hypothetical protein